MDSTAVYGVGLVLGTIFIFVGPGELILLLPQGNSLGLPHFAAFLEGVVDKVNEKEAETGAE